ncbi:MAG: TfoX/Sxy family protein [Phaeovulum sp.]|uniref:TfoX/Sxy family protein n=1 Tax=Phaeovulum sp. TaxID=2934796 RepID=UPI00272F8714|nr:TfoX/Sxy family protein [Phaeovulum sp.]MDP2062638.1 TfoX/Sxy family protein [Phaeovulum sp.]
MPLDPGLLELMRDDLADAPGITERRMFGGVCFLLDGNMVCGVSGEALIYRVGKPSYAEALALPSVRPLTFTGRPMGGMVEVAPDAAEDAPRARLSALALAHARGLPPKAAKG